MRRNWEEKENHRQSERKENGRERVADRQKTNKIQTDKETEKNGAIDFWE